MEQQTLPGIPAAVGVEEPQQLGLKLSLPRDVDRFASFAHEPPPALAPDASADMPSRWVRRREPYLGI